MGKTTTSLTDSQQTIINDSSRYASGDGVAIGGNATNLTIQRLDPAIANAAIASNEAIARETLANTAAYSDNLTGILRSTVEANNALTTGTLTTLRDAFSATLDAPQLAGNAADSGSAMQWAQRNPLLAVLVVAGGAFLVAKLVKS